MTKTTELDGLPLDQRQGLALEEWRRLSTAGQTPLRQEFRPDRISRALPAAMLLHVERGEGGIRFRQRLEGRFAVLAFGEGLGKAIEDIYTDEHLFDLVPRYLESAMTGDPAITHCSVPKGDDGTFEFTRLILPFAGEDGKVSRLFVVFHFDPISLARLPSPLPVRREAGLERSDARFDQRVAPPAQKLEMRRAG